MGAAATGGQPGLGDALDDQLMLDTLRITGLKTKREAVDEALRTLLRLKTQGQIRQLRGKLNWQGNLDAMRTDS